MRLRGNSGTFETSLVVFLITSFFVTPTVSAAPSIPGVGVFFYPWYGHWYHWRGLDNFNPPQNWSSHYVPEILPGVYLPQVELYDSNDTRIILWQLYEMRNAHVSYAISSWWGRGSFEDGVFERLLEVTESNISPHPKLKWCIIYELEGYGDPSAEKIRDDLLYLLHKYAWRPSYLKVDGKPVFFVYAGKNDTVEYARKWYLVKQSLNNSVFIVLKVFPGYRKYSYYADSWFQYAPALRFEVQEPYSGFVSPGFWKLWKNEEPPVLRRDPNEFEKALKHLISSDVGIKTVQTWNEWHEGTQVEPGQLVSEACGAYCPLDGYGEEYVRIMGSLIPKIYRYEPSLEIKPNLVVNDTPFIQLVGRGFPPRSTVEFLVDGELNVTSTRAGVDGSFIWDLPPEDFPEGFHIIVAKSKGYVSVAAFYKPPVKVLVRESRATFTTTRVSTTTVWDKSCRDEASSWKMPAIIIIFLMGLVALLWKLRKM